MIEQIGRVIGIDDDRVRIAFRPTAGCRSCAAGFGCGIGPILSLFRLGRETQIELRHSVGGGLQVGDHVTVRIAASALVRAAALAYLIPLLGMLSGSVLAGLLLPAEGDAAAVSGGITGLALGWLWLVRAQRRRPVVGLSPRLARVASADTRAHS